MALPDRNSQSAGKSDEKVFRYNDPGLSILLILLMLSPLLPIGGALSNPGRLKDLNQFLGFLILTACAVAMAYFAARSLRSRRSRRIVLGEQTISFTSATGETITYAFDQVVSFQKMHSGGTKHTDTFAIGMSDGSMIEVNAAISDFYSLSDIVNWRLQDRINFPKLS